MEGKKGYIRDPIHGYITFSKQLEKPLIDHPLIQRLRYIKQLQLAHLVYPGATHTRFMHSVGTMHIAGRFADALFSRLRIGLLGGFDKKTLIEASRILGLVHDVGHGPFGHAFDEAVFSTHFSNNIKALNHEAFGATIYEYYLKDEIRRHFYGTPLEGAEEIVSQILNGKEPEGILRLVRFTVKDFYYPSDLLDYLMRDSYYTGTVEYGFIDAQRLIESSYPVSRQGILRIALDRKADGALRSLLQAKVSMFEYVYLHHSNRAFDRLLKRILDKKAMELGLVDAIEKLLDGDYNAWSLLWDDNVFHKILKLDDRDVLEKQYLKRRYSPWKLEYTPLRIPLIKAIPRQMLEKYKKELSQLVEKGIGRVEGEIESYWIETAEIIPIPTTVMETMGHGVFLFTDLTDKVLELEEVKPEELTGILGVIPTLHLRVYIRRDIYAKLGRGKVQKLVLDASKKVLEEIDEAYKIRDMISLSRKERLENHERVTM